MNQVSFVDLCLNLLLNVHFSSVNLNKLEYIGSTKIQKRFCYCQVSPFARSYYINRN